MSSRSEMTCACARVFRSITSRPRASTSALAGRRSICVHPRMALSGVRSSWASVATNSSRWRIACSICARAARSADEQRVARLGEPALFVDVGAGAEPARDLAAIAPDGQRASHEPAIRAVAAAPHAVLDVERLAGRERLLPGGRRSAIEVVGVDVELPVPALVRRARHAGVLVPALVVVVDVPVGPRAPDEVRHRVGDRAELLAAVAQLLFVALPLGDVDDNAGDAHRPARFVAQRAARTEQPDLAAGRVQHAVFGAELALVERALHVLLHARRDPTDARDRGTPPGSPAHRRHHADQQAVPGDQ